MDPVIIVSGNWIKKTDMYSTPTVEGVEFCILMRKQNVKNSQSLYSMIMD
ncbi:unnamed protein product [Brassica rapa subsp. trilocularis]